MIQPGSTAVEGESAGAHQCRRRCSPDANDEFAIDAHFDEALLRGAIALLDKIAHVTPIEGVVSPANDDRPRILGARPLEVLLGEGDINHREEVSGTADVTNHEGKRVPFITVTNGSMRTAKWSELEVAKPHAFTRYEWMHCEAHLSQDLLRGRRGARGKENGDGALKPGERRNVEV